MARNTPSSPVENDNATDTSVDTSPAGGAVTDNSIMIYPLRSYLDGKEIRRRGGAGYLSPKHDATSLIAAGLATDTDPQA